LTLPVLDFPVFVILLDVVKRSLIACQEKTGASTAAKALPAPAPMAFQEPVGEGEDT
jgi:hypothetical protein